jgi:tetratricopeptide (TPR) repeat protein
MKQILVFVLLCFLVFPVFPQSPEIQAILEKARSGKQLSESEMGQLKQWGEEMMKKMGGTSVPATEEAPEKATIPTNTLCPPKIPLNPGPALTRESYIRLAKDLMASYGARSGKEAELKALLTSTGKATDGADLGGLFMVAGAGSACIYTTAWSAVQQPDDILTANNLGVALKDMGELAQALRVLKYAESLKPGVGLILSNLGWVYREAGDYTQAKAMFHKALSIAPDMTSPSLGLGLILNCEGNKQEAAKYLRKAWNGMYFKCVN